MKGLALAVILSAAWLPLAAEAGAGAWADAGFVMPKPRNPAECAPTPPFKPPLPHHGIGPLITDSWPNCEAYAYKLYGTEERHPFAPWIENPCGSTDPTFEPVPPACNPRYALTADALFLRRTQPNAGSFTTATGSTFTTTDRVQEGAGTKIQLLLPTYPTGDWQIIFYGTDDWDARWNYDLAPVGSGVLDYRSQLYSTELNFRHELAEWLKWYCGFRYIEYAEEIQFNAPSGGVLSAYQEVTSANYLYGFQLGADVTIWRPFERLQLDASFKGGIHENFIQQARTIKIGETVTSSGDSFDQATLSGEASVWVTYRCTRYCACRFGYQVLRLDEVGDVFAFPNTSATDSLVAQGGFGGIELRW